MKKVLTAIAGVALLASATLGVANAQGKANGPFADVPTDYPAYQSVEKLRDAGIVIGYPDGTYGGRRAMSRYEFAWAIARLLADIPQPQDLSGYATKDWVKGQTPPKQDISGLAKQSDLAQLRADVTRRLSDNEGAIAALRDLINQFTPELKQLGVDIANANARIDALDKRVTALEEEVRRVKITGDVNVIAHADVNTKINQAPAIDQNGLPVGQTGIKSIWTSPAVYNDFLLNIDGRVTEDTHAIVSIDAGNYINWLDNPYRQNSDQANDSASTGLIAGQQIQTFNLYKAYLTTPIKFGFVQATADLGRFGTQFTPFTLRAINPDVYTTLTQNNGDVITDGVKISLAGKGTNLTAFAGEANQSAYAIVAGPTVALDGGRLPGSSAFGGYQYKYGINAAVAPQYTDANVVKDLAGARVIFGSNNWSLGVTGLVGRVNGATVAGVNGVNVAGFAKDDGTPVYYNNFGVYGGDLNVELGRSVTAQGEYAINPLGQQGVVGRVDSSYRNSAWWAGLGAHSGSFNIKADYKKIDTDFAAPGYWGNIGSWINPTNIEGPEVSAKYVFSPKLTLNLEGDFYKGIDNYYGQSPLTKDDNLTRGEGGIKWGICHNTNIDLGYEWVQYNLKHMSAEPDVLLQNGKPVEQYITLGVGHEISKNAAVKLLYQVAAYDDKNTGFYQNSGTSVGSLSGGTFIGQASVKF
jgi:hypothetical protein